jgi:hypothetical protein
MDRNDDFSTPNTGVGGTSGAGSSGSGFGAAGAGGAGGSDFGSSTGGTAGTNFGSGTAGTTGSDFATTGGVGGTEATSRVQEGKQGVADKFGAVKEKVQNLNVKEKVQNLNSSLADRLEAGADKLRQRSQSGQLAGSGAMGATAGMSDQQRMAQYGDKAAAGLEGAADWLRNGDLKESVEQQVRTNPGRTLLIALGLGYVLGKALRK